jgi:hypothetical protein
MTIMTVMKCELNIHIWEGLIHRFLILVLFCFLVTIFTLHSYTSLKVTEFVNVTEIKS